jgi:hypothetical protein
MFHEIKRAMHHGLHHGAHMQRVAEGKDTLSEILAFARRNGGPIHNARDGIVIVWSGPG